MALNDGINASGYGDVVFSTPSVPSSIPAVPIVIAVVAILPLKYILFVGLNSLSIVPYI